MARFRSLLATSVRFLKKYKVIFSNTVYLSIIEVVRLILPFIALPFIISTVGVKNYGTIIFAQTIIVYFSVLVAFGIDIIAVKEISSNRTDKNKISLIVSTMILIKLILFLLCGVVLTILLMTCNMLQQHCIVILFAYIAVLSDVFIMTAFFQGIEKMQYIAITRFVAVLFYISLLFVIVKKTDDYIYIPLLQSSGLFLASLCGIFIMVLSFKIRIIVPPFAYSVKLFKDSLPFFISRISVVLNNNFAKLLSGIFLGMGDVAVLDMAQKICNTAIIPLSMIDQAIYPHNAQQQDKRFARNTFFLVLFAGIAISIIVFLASPIAIHILSKGELNAAIPYTRILCIYIILCSMTYYLGSPVLVAFGHTKEFNMSVIASTICALLMYITILSLSFINLNSFIGMLIFTETFILVYRLFYINKFQLFQR